MSTVTTTRAFSCARAVSALRASSAALAIAISCQGGSAFAQQAASPSADAQQPVEEIIVTASKRSEAVRSVSGDITALTGDQLDAIGAQSFKDYLTGLPGVQFQQSTPGVSNVTMRGVGTATIYPDQGQATTGIYVNDVPMTDPGFALAVPDLDVFDVQRVEVLKGPQGSLFGSATLGGAVNYIYNPVSLTDLQAGGQTSLEGIQNSSGVGYTVKGVVNVPIVNDVFGIRVAGVQRQDPGYLDNIGTNQSNTNTHAVTAFRLNALLALNDDFKLSYFFLYDRSHIGDGFYSFPASGQLVRDTAVNEGETFMNEVNNVKLDGDLGFASLTVSVADVHKEQNSIADETPFNGVGPSYGTSAARDDSQIAEVRLTSPDAQRFEWLVGAYYGRTKEYYPTPNFFGDGTEIYDFTVDYHNYEKALFGEATYHLTDTLKIMAGGRYYDIDLSTITASSAPGVPQTFSGGSTKDYGFSPKASITFEPSKDVMVYGLVSRGFRSGGVNLNPSIASFPTPATYGSDSVYNFELGTRLSFFDRTLLIDTSLFYIDWSNIQLRLSRPDGRSYVANAGDAHNYGVENAVTWRPSARFDTQVNVTYLSAEIAKTLDLGNGTVYAKGLVLPGASKWTTSVTATYHFDLEHEPYVMLQDQYVSGATDDFDPTLPVGNYNTIALRTGAHFGNFDVQAYVTNLTDRRGVTAAEYFGNPLTAFYIQPRTIGASVEWHL